MEARKLGRVTRLPATAVELPLLDEAEQRWTLRARFLFIITAASICWAVPATIAYLVFAH